MIAHIFLMTEWRKFVKNILVCIVKNVLNLVKCFLIILVFGMADVMFISEKLTILVCRMTGSFLTYFKGSIRVLLYAMLFLFIVRKRKYIVFGDVRQNIISAIMILLIAIWSIIVLYFCVVTNLFAGLEIKVLTSNMVVCN